MFWMLKESNTPGLFLASVVFATVNAALDIVICYLRSALNSLVNPSVYVCHRKNLRSLCVDIRIYKIRTKLAS